MSLACPNCGSRFLRDSRPRDFREKINRLRLISPLRCLNCQTRFVSRTLIFSDLKYSRCPRCHRMDLNGWTGKTYEPPFFVRLKIYFGARRWRCEYCRINFATFRNRKEVFTFKRWKDTPGAIEVAEAEKQGSNQNAVN
jgi:DNA-directed RNA polymerase subunit RPC12/RpoP